ncbi:sugar phosphate isomerase/epimerase [Rhodopirellula rubra]|uniref:Sugar phosphate isomerase/epimerase n=1 Tax=Aporhodopirellula rubra TaxID=980271 RepID=A0A7W5E542_9BACT|nr:sugar phosphate isomerase/epimerase [Aporhodopirellula rubra]MBB3210386.1 sugar phosphate isomerase/epimerase [Aporhodopirellula rubra]
MKLGFVSAILPELPLEELFKVASDVGYDCIEVMCWPPGNAKRRYAGVTHLDVSNLSAPLIEQVHGLTAKYGIEISSLGYYPNPLTPDSSQRELAVRQIGKLISAAQQLGIGVVTTFAGRDWTKTVEQNWPAFLETWIPLAALAEEHEVRIGIENCPMLFTQDEWPGGCNLFTTPATWRKAFEDIPGNSLGLNYDPSHFVWQRMDYLKAIREFGNRFYHVHAKDVRIDQNRLDEVGIMGCPTDYHTPKLPGMGDVHWGKFFSLLTDAGYDGAVCVEVEDRAFEGSLESRIQALKTSHNFLRQYVPKT